MGLVNEERLIGLKAYYRFLVFRSRGLDYQRAAEEVGAELNLSPSTVLGWVTRLRKELKDEDPTP
jgi:hypothetical protein